VAAPLILEQWGATDLLTFWWNQLISGITGHLTHLPVFRLFIWCVHCKSTILTYLLFSQIHVTTWRHWYWCVIARLFIACHWNTISCTVTTRWNGWNLRLSKFRASMVVMLEFDWNQQFQRIETNQIETIFANRNYWPNNDSGTLSQSPTRLYSTFHLSHVHSVLQTDDFNETIPNVYSKHPGTAQLHSHLHCTPHSKSAYVWVPGTCGFRKCWVSRACALAPLTKLVALVRMRDLLSTYVTPQLRIKFREDALSFVSPTLWNLPPHPLRTYVLRV